MKNIDAEKYYKLLKKETGADDTAWLEAVKRELHDARNQPPRSDSVRCEIEHVYGSVDGRELDGDLFTPVHQPEKPRPAIIFAHGGCWKFGSPSQFHYHAHQLAERFGFFAISVDYRMSQEAPFPAALQDLKCAARWIRTHADEWNIDPERIVACGGSAGANLASLMLTTAGVADYEGDGGYSEQSSHVNLGVLYNGEFDMWDLLEKGSLIEAMYLFTGGTPFECPERYDELSTVQRIAETTPPALLLHGTADNCVSHQQSVDFHARMKEKGCASELELYEGMPHAWFNRPEDKKESYDRMERFLVEQFGLATEG